MEITEQVLAIIDRAVAKGFDYFAMNSKEKPKKVASHTLNYQTQILTITYADGSAASSRVAYGHDLVEKLHGNGFLQSFYGKKQNDKELQALFKTQKPVAHLFAELKSLK